MTLGPPAQPPCYGSYTYKYVREVDPPTSLIVGSLITPTCPGPDRSLRSARHRGYHQSCLAAALTPQPPVPSPHHRALSPSSVLIVYLMGEADDGQRRSHLPACRASPTGSPQLHQSPLRLASPRQYSPSPHPSQGIIPGGSSSTLSPVRGFRKTCEPPKDCRCECH